MGMASGNHDREAPPHPAPVVALVEWRQPGDCRSSALLLPTVSPGCRFLAVAELVGVDEIARLVGVSRQRVNAIARSDSAFPEPLAELAAGRIWDRAEIEKWVAVRARREQRTIVSDINGITLVTPHKFAEVEALANEFMKAKPVIFELRRLDQMLQRRCIDFASGLAYGLRGQVSRVADKVLLLEPEGTRLSQKERRAISDQL